MTRSPHIVEIDKLILHGVDRLDARAVELVRGQVEASVMAAVATRGETADRISAEAGSSVARALSGMGAGTGPMKADPR